MQKLFTLFVLILLTTASSNSLQAQLQAAQWYIQNGYFLDFRSSPPTLISRPNSSGFYTTTTSMCERDGDLQFYGDHSTVFDRVGNIMPGSFPTLVGPIGPNGTSRLVGQVMAVETNLLNQYIYVVGDGVPNAMDRSWRVRTARVNMNTRGGLGDIGLPSRELVPTDDISAFAGGYSCEADKYWLVVVNREFPGADRSIFYCYSLEGDRFNDTPVVSFINDVRFSIVGTAAGHRFRLSPDCKRILLPELEIFTGGRMSLLDFDPFTGIVSNPVRLDTFSRTVWGAEFSPNSQLAYVVDTSQIFQYDLTTNPPTKFVLGNNISPPDDSLFLFPTLQLAIDGTLWMSMQGRSSLSAILQPNIFGSGADFQLGYFQLPEPRETGSLPSFSSHYFNIPLIEGEVQRDTVICPFDSIRLANTLDTDEGFIWAPAEFIDNPLAQNPIFSFPGFPRQDTTIVMTVQLQENCAFRRRINVTIKGQAA
ncbi:MAG: hypothetical protein AAFV07_16215, partial [Bacteroidota bacterium]